MKIFLSYTTRDSCVTRKFLENLNQLLNDRWSIYIDLLHNKSSDKQNEVLSQLKSSDLIVKLNTPSTDVSPWVKIEIDLAIQLQKSIIEVFWDGKAEAKLHKDFIKKIDSAALTCA